MTEYPQNTVPGIMNPQLQVRGYQRTREMTLDDMLLDNRIVFLIGVNVVSELFVIEFF